MPQNDLLADPRIALFLTHGGIASCHEASYAGVPVIVVPIFGDQPRNAGTLVQHGNGINFSKFYTVHSDKMADAVGAILGDSSYAANAKKLAEQLRNPPISPRTLLVQHIEYAARFGPSPTSRPAGIDLSYVEYFNIDVFAGVIALVTMVLYTVFMIARSLPGGTDLVGSDCSVVSLTSSSTPTMKYNVSLGTVLCLTFPSWTIARSDSSTLLSLQCIEVAILLFSFAAFFPCVYAMNKHAYLLHVNMRRILFYFGVHHNFYPVLRLTILLYQMGLVETQGHLPADLPYFFAQIVNGYHIFAGHYSLVILIAERLVATILISNYEATKRLYISTSLITFAIAASVFVPWLTGYFVDCEPSTNPVLAILLSLSNSFMLATFIGLVVRNYRLKKRFSQSVQSGYTLAMMYQIRENLRAFKLLRNGMACLIGGAVLQSTASLIFAQRISTDAEFRIIFQEAFDLATTICVSLLLVVGTLSIKEWRRTLIDVLLLKTLRRRNKVSHVPDAPPPSRSPSQIQATLETEMYFKGLRDSWR